jgi:hypothetical protein
LAALATHLAISLYRWAGGKRGPQVGAKALQDIAAQQSIEELIFTNERYVFLIRCRKRAKARAS